MPQQKHEREFIICDIRGVIWYAPRSVETIDTVDGLYMTSSPVNYTLLYRFLFAGGTPSAARIVHKQYTKGTTYGNTEVPAMLCAQ